jgi:hypothetical protein
MGYYSEYLNKGLNYEQLNKERKVQLERISTLRGRDVLVYAAKISNQNPDVNPSIEFDDTISILDQLSYLSGDTLDFILESGGGSGEVAEEIIRIIRDKYPHLSVIVPGWAKSAATIMSMAADEILMGKGSALGPIDSQITWQGKRFSAGEFIEALEDIKAESAGGGLNPAYIPILQRINPGEIKRAENGLQFAKELVTQWLSTHKFKDWHTHSSTGDAVTEDHKLKRAGQIAEQLCDHKRWRTHGRSIRLADLHEMRVLITDYTAEAELAEAIDRYYALLRILFDSTTIFKVFETPNSEIFRVAGVAQPAGQPPPQQAGAANFDFTCPRCHHVAKVQANLGEPQPLAEGHTPFPTDNRYNCPNCGAVSDLTAVRRMIEKQSGKPIVQEAI